MFYPFFAAIRNEQLIAMHTNEVLFIGLGVMGYHMAHHLSHDFNVWVYNRTPSKKDRWLESYQGKSLDDLTTIPASINVIITCIGKDKDLEEVYLGPNGLLARAQENTLFIDHTTASASVAKRLHQQAIALGHQFVDAPVSGGEQGAINGQLTIMCGGDTEHYQRALPYLNAYARASTHVGPSGNGQLTKMANQIAVTGILQSLSEALHFCEQAGLDCHQVIDVISKGAAQSWQMENRSNTMIDGEYEHGFAVDLMRKDLEIVLGEARNLKASLPLTAIIDQFYGDVQAMGGGRWDTSSLLERLRLNPSKNT